MWRQRIEKLCPSAEFGGACPEKVLAIVEKKLRTKLPEPLRQLLAEANGVTGDDGLDLIWPAERIRDDNLQFRADADFRELYMPFDALLFFGDAGDGNQFAFAICGGAIRRPDVFVWDHETDSRTWIAPSLERYLEGATAGTLEA